jgi:hypothetical protein
MKTIISNAKRRLAALLRQLKCNHVRLEVLRYSNSAERITVTVCPKCGETEASRKVA